MIYQSYSGGEETTIGIAESWKPGDVTDPAAWVAPTSWLMAEADGLQSKPNQIERDVMGAGRDSDLGHRTGKVKNGGTLSLGLFPTNAIDLLVGAVGNRSTQVAVPSINSTAVATANGRTTFTVASSTGFVVGRPALIDVAGVQEVKALMEMTATTLVFAQCSLVHGAVTALAQPTVELIAPYSRASGFGNLLRRYCIEDAPGLKYANRYQNGQVGKWALKAGASKFDVSADLVFSVPRDTANNLPTDLDETVGGWGELGFEFTDGYLSFPADPTGSGTAVLQLVVDGQDWDLTIDNKMREVASFDNTDSYKYFPGKRQIDVTYEILNQSDRPVAYSDFVMKNIDVPWFSQVAINTGSNTAKKFQGLFIYMPNARFKDAEEIKTGDKMIGEKVMVRGLKAGGLEKIYIYRLITP